MDRYGKLCGTPFIFNTNIWTRPKAAVSAFRSPSTPGALLRSSYPLNIIASTLTFQINMEKWRSGLLRNTFINCFCHSRAWHGQGDGFFPWGEQRKPKIEACIQTDGVNLDAIGIFADWGHFQGICRGEVFANTIRLLHTYCILDIDSSFSGDPFELDYGCRRSIMQSVQWHIISELFTCPVCNSATFVTHHNFRFLPLHIRV